MAQATTDQANAQAALTKENAAVDTYNQNLGNFMQFGRRTYGADGDFARNANARATTQAAAGSKAISGDLALNAMRTGSNTANYAPAEAEARRQGSRDLTGQMLASDTNRLQQLGDIEKYGVEASKYPAGVYGSIYGTSTSGAGNQLDAAGSAAKTPGFFDEFLPAIVGGAGQAFAGAGTKAIYGKG